MNGVIIIDKPFGKTSHDMVSFIRRLTGIRRVGHTGTLDPAATGVLPICIGKGTKAADMLTASDKGYRVEFVLGMTTDTLDAEGEVLAECDVTSNENDIRSAINDFVGEIEQIPPMYSAIKQDGKKLYELAREGKEIERKHRHVTIYSIDICDVNMTEYTVTMEVMCSKGTYIRTLCEDIGIKLGCGAYVNKLCRIKSGMFTIDDVHTADELEQLADKGLLGSVLISIDKLFNEYESIILDKKQVELVKNGVRISYLNLNENEIYRLYDDKQFLCLSSYHNGLLIMDKAFW